MINTKVKNLKTYHVYKDNCVKNTKVSLNLPKRNPMQNLGSQQLPWSKRI